MNWMNDLAALWQTHGGWAIGGLLALVGAGFVLHFVLPALWLGRDLQRAIRALTALAANNAPTDPQQIGREVMATPRLAHLWREYVQTLHGLTPAKGAPQVAVWRATTMAEQFFTEQALVDTPLKTEFYKHLPGILTGAILALGRALGETAAVLLTAGSDPGMPRSVLDPGRSLAVHLYLLSTEGLADGRAYATALVLVCGVLAVNLVANLTLERWRRDR